MQILAWAGDGKMEAVLSSMKSVAGAGHRWPKDCRGGHSLHAVDGEALAQEPVEECVCSHLPAQPFSSFYQTIKSKGEEMGTKIH
jgi:hypothetical protein